MTTQAARHTGDHRRPDHGAARYAGERVTSGSNRRASCEGWPSPRYSPYGKRTLYGSIQQNVATSHPLRGPASGPLRRPRGAMTLTSNTTLTHSRRLLPALLLPAAAAIGVMILTAPAAHALAEKQIQDECAAAGGTYTADPVGTGNRCQRADLHEIDCAPADFTLNDIRPNRGSRAGGAGRSGRVSSPNGHSPGNV